MGTNIKKKKKVYLETAIQCLPVASDGLCTPCRFFQCPSCKKIAPFVPDCVGHRPRISHGVIFLCIYCVETSVFDEKGHPITMNMNYLLASMFSFNLDLIAEMRSKCAMSKN